MRETIYKAGKVGALFGLAASLAMGIFDALVWYVPLEAKPESLVGTIEIWKCWDGLLMQGFLLVFAQSLLNSSFTFCVVGAGIGVLYMYFWLHARKLVFASVGIVPIFIYLSIFMQRWPNSPSMKELLLLNTLWFIVWILVVETSLKISTDTSKFNR